MPETLNWLPLSPWCVKSICGNYSISKEGPDFSRTYSAWYIRNKSKKFLDGELLEVFRDLPEADMRQLAKARCQQHADELAAHIKEGNTA